MIKVVIFDLDDTLISEREYIKSGYKEVAKGVIDKYDLKLTEEEVYNLLNELFLESNKQVFNRLLDRLNIQYSNEDVLKLVQLYRNHIPNIKYYDDVLDVIAKLKEKNIMLGIITDGYIETQKNKLNVIKAAETFDKIIMTEELGREYWKPHPKAFQMMKEYFDVEYEEIIYVGDNPHKDFYIKHQLPINTVRIIRENGVYKNEQYKDNIAPDHLIKNLKELLNLVICE